jgi:hypothetical protein
MDMDLGFCVPNFDIDGGTTTIAGELARVGKSAGAAWMSLMDHSFQVEPIGLPVDDDDVERLPCENAF